MQTRIAIWIRRLAWQLLVLPLALLLAACGASQSPVAPAASTTLPAASASPAGPIGTAVPAKNTAPAAAASPAAPVTAGPTLSVAAATAESTSPATAALTTGSPTPDPAVAAVLAYLDARAKADVAAVTTLACKTWKSKAVTEAVSFRSMNARLVGLTCQVNGSAGSFTLVGCGGKMVTTYGTETKDWDLSTFVYQVTAEDGQWKMCGYHS